MTQPTIFINNFRTPHPNFSIALLSSPPFVNGFDQTMNSDLIITLRQNLLCSLIFSTKVNKNLGSKN